MDALNETLSSTDEANKRRLSHITEATAVVSDLSAVQRQWLIRYLFHGNATKAAEEVGYKNPNKIGPRLRRAAKIRAAIDEYFFADEMSAKEAIAVLSNQARGTMEDFIHFSANADGRDIEGVEPELSLLKARRRGKLALVKKFKKKRTIFTDKDGGETVTEWMEIELYDAQAAAVHIGRRWGIFGAKGDEDDPLHTVGMTLDEWRAAAAKRRQEAAATMAQYAETVSADTGNADGVDSGDVDIEN